MGVTTPGTIIGTFQYMSPEQVEGKEADARSDIFSFGVLLYEMVTAKKAFSGKSQVSLLAAILEADPAPPSTVTLSLPRDFERLIQVCLAKDAEDRYQSAREIVRDLKWIQSAPEQLSAGAPSGPASKMRWASGRWGWSAAVIALIAGVGLAAVHFTERASPRPVVRFNVLPPEGTAFPGTTPRMAISPDGTQLAFQFQGSQGKEQMWVRRLDSVEARAIPGTENAETPFWSPDSRFIGFFADNKLKRVEAAGGPVQILCDGPGNDGAARGIATGPYYSAEGIPIFP
jgi:serine/threonine protein kinase